MEKFLILFTYLISLEIFAAIPTVEALFRNPSNKEVESQTVMFTYSITEQNNELLMQKTESETTDQDLENEMLKEKNEPIYIRQYISSSEDRRSHQSIAYVYKSSQMTPSDLINVKFYPAYHAKIINEFDVNKRLFHSLKTMFLLNDSKIIGTFLKEKANGYRSNSDLLDEEKKQLFGRYKEYLIATKEDPDLRGELTSPLNPTDLEERGKVLDLMKRNMYQNLNQVSLIREQRDFYWQVNLGTLVSHFTNEGHRLRKLELQIDGKIDVTTGDYVLFDGVHELPKILFYKTTDDRIYKIQFLSLKHYRDFKKSFTKRIRDLSDLEKKIRESGFSYKEHPLIL